MRLEILPAGKGAKTRIVTLTRERIRLEDRAVKMSVKTVGKEKSACWIFRAFTLVSPMM